MILIATVQINLGRCVCISVIIRKSDFGYCINVTANLEELPLKWPPVPRDVEGPFYRYFMH